ncbi:DNA translocase FtsK [Burkholderia gladioli]|uniref:DNA translocase FtsK n=1 Tax=Burkholderia gladioli TaxID=28095 RepID=UPI001FC895C5|nr:DNA translocase FtsK [Burkholderia gladioli]
MSATAIDHYAKPDDQVPGVTGGKTDAELYPLAVSIVLEHKRASVSLVQRTCRCGYNQAARLLELMVENRLGVIRRDDCKGFFEFDATVAVESGYSGPREQMTLPSTPPATSTRPSRKRPSDGGWSRGYFCAVALLLNEEGGASEVVRSLFRQGGSTDGIEESDAALFRAHGLMD